ncbi:hypothetical protein Micbo1qcDRAFT_180097 [Microdochium bolleyi]|uniref:Uncharacterized protein n=1 Tax=Microdochium bolleyi TaxID=196109 RepID=A0A136IMZ3_9PEZI|nr:hypothetical protein Micbo1qcDRAFT_180097 [Microdochium bolleyi]
MSSPRINIRSESRHHVSPRQQTAGLLPGQVAPNRHALSSRVTRSSRASQSSINQTHREILIKWNQDCEEFKQKIEVKKERERRKEQSLERLQDELLQRQLQLEKSETANAKYREEISKRDVRDARWRRKASDWANREHELSSRVTKLQHKIVGQEQKLHAAQDAAKSIMEESRSYAMSDDDIRMQLAAMAGDWKDWVRQFAHKDVGLLKTLHPADAAELQQSIAGFAVTEGDWLQKNLFDGPRTKGTPGLLLQGMLATFISVNILASWDTTLQSVRAQFVGSNASEMTADSQVSTIAELFNTMRMCDEKSGHQIRATIIRTITRAGLNAPGEGDSPRAEKARRCRRDISNRHADEFLSGPARFLFKELDAGAADLREVRLTELIEQALVMSSQLWSQRSVVYQSAMRFFDGTMPQDHHFTEPHKSQLRLVDEIEDEYYNLPLGMVIQPAIVAVGTEDGQRYDKVTRVWLKAQTWRIPRPAE